MTELTPEQLAELRQLLQDNVTKFSEQIDSLSRTAQPVALDQPIGRLSRMDALQSQAMADSNKRALKLRLDATKRAIRMCEDEAYGECQHCGEYISYKRLKAKPESAFCIQCQQERER